MCVSILTYSMQCMLFIDDVVHLLDDSLRSMGDNVNL